MMLRTYIHLLVLLIATAAGCGGTVQSYEFANHTIRIDRTHGAEAAQVYVDECQVEGMYYDRVAQQWGVRGYTYGATYWELELLAEDIANASIDRPDATPGLSCAPRTAAPFSESESPLDEGEGTPRVDTLAAR